MRPGALLSSTAVSMLLLACAQTRAPVVLGPIGPPPSTQAQPCRTGTLRVFTALDPAAHFDSLPGHYFYTGYSILSEDGKVLRQVRNNEDCLMGAPETVALPPGRYRVVARANGYGVVNLQVVVAAGQRTTIHLEGGGLWGSDRPSPVSNPVRLPDGRIVGWRSEG